MKDPGFIYVLINPTLTGLVKIGKTNRDPELRARELSQATGVATPFHLAYALPFSDADAAERYLHSLLEIQGFRLTANREFFQIPLQKTIELMMDVQRQLSTSSEPGAALPNTASADADLTEIDFCGINRHPAYDIFTQALDHWYGHGDTIQDMDEALRLLDHARKLDFPAAYTSLAKYYFEDSDDSDPIDIPKAMEYLKEGARRGHGRCYIAMAFLFLNRGHMENFQKCWKKYFTGQTFLRDDDNKWTQDLDIGGVSRRVAYIGQYLAFSLSRKPIVPPEILPILAPFRDELIPHLSSMMNRFMQSPDDQDARSLVAEYSTALEYVERHF